MTVTQTRFKNMTLLSDGISRDVLARKLGYHNTNYVNQLLSGHGSFGSNTARKCEKAFNLAEGSLDDPYFQAHSDVAAKAYETCAAYLSAPEHVQSAVDSLLQLRSKD